MLKSNGFIAVLEGPEGSGKTTVAPLLKEKLEDAGYECLISREPGGTALGEKLRPILKNDEMTPMSELLLFIAARHEHYNNVIKPFVAKGGVVILDRYIPASIAIQGHARGLGDIVCYLHDVIMPPKAKEYSTYFIDIPVELGLERKSNQEDGVCKFELEGLEFQKKTYDGYMKVLEDRTFNCKRINGMQSPSDIASDIFNSIILSKGGH